jgi:malonyl-CoA/methylmalonyl-CoA synthetase
VADSFEQLEGTDDYKHLSDYLLKNAKKNPGKLALVDGKVRLSWKDLWQQVEPLALSLAANLGGRQQVVAILMPNSWQCVVTNLAVLHAGHVVLPLDVVYKTLEIDAIINQLSPSLVIADKANFPRTQADKAHTVVFEELNDLIPNHDSRLLRLPVEKQLASLLFTSGTTGTPKVTPHNHFHHLWNVRVCSEVWGWTAEDSLLISLRLTHWYGLVMGMIGALYHGNTLYLQDRFEADRTLQILTDEPITIFTHTPSAFAKMLDVPGAGNYDLSDVRLFISGSAPLSPVIWRQFEEQFNHKILEVYGTSETGRIASNSLIDRRPASPGQLLPGVEVKLGNHSEVLVKSPGVVSGYYKNQEATRAARTPDGWWRTGDVGQLTNQRLSLKGRLHEKIRKSGYTLSPRDIEWALAQNKRIKEVHVVGIQQPGTADDKLVYYLVTDAPKSQITDFCKENLPSIWRPDKIVILPQLPRNRSGKVNIDRLKQMEKPRS